MRFSLEGVIELSRPIDFLKLDFPKIVAREINSELFRKGVPSEQEGSRIVSWSIIGTRLLVTIEGTTYLRPHDALLRLRNYFTEKLGKHNVGVRRIFVKNYLIEFETRASDLKIRELVGNFAQVKMKGRRLTLIFENLEEKDLEQRFVENVLKEIKKLEPSEIVEEEKLAKYGHVLKRTKLKTIGFDKDVAETAQKLGWIKRFPGRGQWILLAPAAKLLYTLKDIIVNEILKPLKFEEYIFPKLTSFEVMKKMPGYFEHLAEGMFYVSAPPREPLQFEEFKRYALLKKEIRGDLLKRILGEPEYVLAPAQCEPFYQLFSGETVNAKDLPIKAYDFSGCTWRSEGGGVEGIIRTTEFWRLEAVWLGLPEQSLELRDVIIDKTFEVIDKILDLEARVVVGAPFYATEEMVRTTFVDISKSVNIPTLDVEVWLPYKGPRDKAEWLEVGAGTCAKTKYVDSFNIKEASGKEIWTGCMGFGLTRLLAGFLAQKGFEPDVWPLGMKKKIKKLPSPAKMVSWP
ncbi:MAG: serine--tRNA ligase [Candidatus Aenigmarchaeota archaeon]|nr:serine--tRNA ligase [Candidatus Aenigmarchaeota archaeon]